VREVLRRLCIAEADSGSYGNIEDKIG